MIFHLCHGGLSGTGYVSVSATPHDRDSGIMWQRLCMIKR